MRFSLRNRFTKPYSFPFMQKIGLLYVHYYKTSFSMTKTLEIFYQGSKDGIYEKDQ